MKSYLKFVRSHQSLVELAALLVELPSRRSSFFNFLVKETGLPPNTLKMVLCPTSSGVRLSATLAKKVSLALGLSEEVLFPMNRCAAKSLISLYAQQSYQSIEYEELVEDLRFLTGRSRQAVISWLYGRHSPRCYSQKIIGELLGQPVSSLFPKSHSSNK